MGPLCGLGWIDGVSSGKDGICMRGIGEGGEDCKAERLLYLYSVYLGLIYRPCIIIEEATRGMLVLFCFEAAWPNS